MPHHLITNTNQVLFSKANVYGWSYCSPEWSWRPEHMPNFDLWYVVSGQGRMIRDGQSFDLTPGSLHFIRPGEKIEATQDPFNRLSVIFIHFLTQDRAETMMPLVSRGNDRMEAAIRQMLVIDRNRRIYAEEFDQLMKTVIQTAANGMHLEDAGAGTLLLNEEETWVRDIIELIQLDPANASPQVTLRLPHYSLRHAQRLFKQYTGRSMREYIHLVKMNRAWHWLKHHPEGAPIAHLAHLLGYEDPFAFSKSFKRFFGISPADYRSLNIPRR